MSALDTQILIHRMEDSHAHRGNHQRCTLDTKGNFHDDLMELTESCERLQIAENILQKCFNGSEVAGVFGDRIFIDSAARLTPDELDYLRTLMLAAL